jgi:hypothetical protein
MIEILTKFSNCNAETLVAQIGMMNIFAISGGRVTVRPTGITLPVSNGYSVEIDLANDTYTVQRIFTRGGKRFIKGIKEGIFCDSIAEQAIQASSFRSYEWGN